MRNPASLKSTWPELFDGLVSLRKLFITFRSLFSGFQGFAGCCGSEPARQPPLDDEVLALRRCMAILYGKDAEYFVSQPLASPWLPNVVDALREATLDEDVALVKWLREGAPHGFGQGHRVWWTFSRG